jgi:hypothetical protein
MGGLSWSVFVYPAMSIGICLVVVIGHGPTVAMV